MLSAEEVYQSLKTLLCMLSVYNLVTVPFINKKKKCEDLTEKSINEN